MEEENLQVKGIAGTIPVYCSFDEILPLDKITPNPKNPNVHPEDQLVYLAKVIKKQGWRSPIVISKRSGLVVKGHGRLLVAMNGGMQFAPVDYQDYESESSEYADMTADNRLAELSTMTDELLADVLREMETEFYEYTGYTEEEIDKILSDIEEPEEMEQVTSVQKYELVIACADEIQMDALFNEIQKEGLAVQKKVTQII